MGETERKEGVHGVASQQSQGSTRAPGETTRTVSQAASAQLEGAVVEPSAAPV